MIFILKLMKKVLKTLAFDNMVSTFIWLTLHTSTIGQMHTVAKDRETKW